MNHLIAIIQSTQTIEREYCLVDSIASTKGTYALKDIISHVFHCSKFFEYNHSILIKNKLVIHTCPGIFYIR